MKLQPKSAAAHYYMGKAYKNAYDFETARDMFKKVLDFNDSYLKDSDEEWRLMDKIQRAMPGTENGKRIALVESITRADAAALFMEEMKLDVLYKKRTPAIFQDGFRGPGKGGRQEIRAAAAAIGHIGPPAESGYGRRSEARHPRAGSESEGSSTPTTRSAKASTR